MSTMQMTTTSTTRPRTATAKDITVQFKKPNSLFTPLDQIASDDSLLQDSLVGPNREQKKQILAEQKIRRDLALKAQKQQEADKM